jgi:hypothetical protein
VAVLLDELPGALRPRAKGDAAFHLASRQADLLGVQQDPVVPVDHAHSIRRLLAQAMSLGDKPSPWLKLVPFQLVVSAPIGKELRRRYIKGR